MLSKGTGGLASCALRQVLRFPNTLIPPDLIKGDPVIDVPDSRKHAVWDSLAKHATPGTSNALMGLLT